MLSLAERSYPDERSRQALTRLVAAARCERGWLYLLRGATLELACGEAETAEHRAVATDFLSRNTENVSTADDDAKTKVDSARAAALRPVLLTYAQDGQRMWTIGVLLLEGANGLPPSFYGILRDICQALVVSPTSLLPTDHKLEMS